MFWPAEALEGLAGTAAADKLAGAHSLGDQDAFVEPPAEARLSMIVHSNLSQLLLNFIARIKSFLRVLSHYALLISQEGRSFQVARKSRWWTHASDCCLSVTQQLKGMIN